MKRLWLLVLLVGCSPSEDKLVTLAGLMADNIATCGPLHEYAADFNEFNDELDRFRRAGADPERVAQWREFAYLAEKTGKMSSNVSDAVSADKSFEREAREKMASIGAKMKTAVSRLEDGETIIND